MSQQAATATSKKSSERADLVLIASLVLLVVYVVAVVGFYALRFSESPLGGADAFGQFGDYFGGMVNPLVGTLSVILIVFQLRANKSQAHSDWAQGKQDAWLAKVDQCAQKFDALVSKPLFTYDLLSEPERSKRISYEDLKLSAMWTRHHPRALEWVRTTEGDFFYRVEGRLKTFVLEMVAAANVIVSETAIDEDIASMALMQAKHYLEDALALGLLTATEFEVWCMWLERAEVKGGRSAQTLGAYLNPEGKHQTGGPDSSVPKSTPR